MTEPPAFEDPRICRDGGEHAMMLSSTYCCMVCGITPERLRDAMRDWRYDWLMAKMIEVVEKLDR